MRPDRLLLFIILPAALAVAACSSRDPEVVKREYVESGDRFVTEGRLVEAAIEYRNAIRQDPRFGEARHKLAEVLLKSGDTAGAYREYVRAADLLPADLDVQLSAGRFYLLTGEFRDAEARADRALAIEPGNVDALILKGNALARLQQLDAAMEQVEEAIRVEPERGFSYSNLGALQLAKGNPQEAGRSFEKAVEIAPSSVEARVALANFYWSNGQRDRAEAVLKEALGLRPEDRTINRMLAYLYLSSDRPHEAESHLKVVADHANDPAARLELADYYRGQGMTSEAMDILTLLEDDSTLSASAAARKGILLYAEGRTQDAHTLLDNALSRDPAHPYANLAKAELLAADRRLDEALTFAQTAVRAQPGEVRAHFAVGRLQRERGRTNEAIAAFTEVLRLRPRFVMAQIELSRLYLIARRPQDALQLVREALATVPENGDALLLEARALRATGSLAPAEQTLRKLVAEYPKSPVIHAELGDVARLRGDARAARDAYDRALALDRLNTEAVAGLTALDTAEQRHEAARRRIDGVLSERPDSVALLILAARADASGGDYARAERTLRQALEVEPSNPQPYAMLGELYRAQSRLAEAIVEYERLAELTPDLASVHTTLGTLLEAQKRPDDARKRYETALRLDARAPVAANNLALLHAAQDGNLDRALELAQVAKQVLPDHPGVADTLGWIYYKRGLFSSAIALLKQAVDGESGNATYQYHLGLAYLKNGDQALARRTLEAALKLDPASDYADEARGELTRLAALAP